MNVRTLNRVKAPALRRGDRVGIVAPASNIKRSELDAGCAALQRAGYEPFYFDSIVDQDLYFAGSVERRVRELEAMFTREDVRAIVCARGGYGANYLLEALDIEKVRAHPKVLVGYSDVTTLLTYFVDRAGLVCFHGPMAAKDWAHADGVEMASWLAALEGSSEWGIAAGPAVKGLADGIARGVLYGGCLSMLVASLGTPYEIQTEGTVLFVEDVAVKPYQIDRMLMQLKLAGKLNGVRGLVFGEMTDCFQTANQGYTLEEVIMKIVGSLGVPVAFGVRSGHVASANLTLPLGVEAELSVQDGAVKLKILEAATVNA
jgi:muramoyltetrapeptide carboxypeptidase